MDISCLIPTHKRAAKLAKCVAGLASQQAEGIRFEVLVGVDGPDRGETDAVAAAFAAAGHPNVPVRVSVDGHAGPAATRNRLIASARGRVLLFLNDDVRPDSGLIANHARAHAELNDQGTTAMILGAAPWIVPERDTLFDRLVRETSMVFFYDQMVGAKASDPAHDWGFRHAWTLNLSVPADAVRSVDGFDPQLNAPCFEDLEFAYRLQHRRRLPVLYRPGAIVHHDHRYTPGEYLTRERTLGEHAWNLAQRAPECAHAVFGRDITAGSEIEYSREFVEREAKDAARLETSFRKLAGIAPGAIPPSTTNEGRALMGLLYQQHVLVKRWNWRSGLLQAAGALEASLTWTAP